MVIRSDEELVNRVLPDTSIAIAFRFKGEVNFLSNDQPNHLPLSVISGLRKSFRLINYLKGSAAIIVQFKEAGASAFFRQPLYELFEQSISLDNLIPLEKIRIIEERLAGAKHDNERIALIEELLLSKIFNIQPDELVSSAVQKIFATRGSIKIKELSNTMHLSQDAFEKRFRRTIGTTPKQFSSIVRMKAVIQSIQKNQTFTDLAYDSGFFDQAHFNKEFKLFTGQPPTDFFRSPSLW